MICICRIMLVLVLIIVASGLDSTKVKHHTPPSAPTMVFVGWAFESSRTEEETE